MSVTAGGVGLCITDLLAYAKFHMGDGTAANGERVLSRASLELMRTPQLQKQSTDDEIGLGWHLRRVGPLRVAAHGGTLGGHILLLEIVPERNFAIGILTNSSNGWRLIQDVEREALRAYHGATFAKNQAIAHRGLVETLPNVEPLATQPDLKPYVGRYLRPMNAVDVRVEGGKLVVQEIPNSGDAASGDADRLLRSRSRGGDRRQRSRPVDRVRARCEWIGEVGPRRRQSCSPTNPEGT